MIATGEDEKPIAFVGAHPISTVHSRQDLTIPSPKRTEAFFVLGASRKDILKPYKDKSVNLDGAESKPDQSGARVDLC